MRRLIHFATVCARLHRLTLTDRPFTLNSGALTRQLARASVQSAIKAPGVHAPPRDFFLSAAPCPCPSAIADRHQSNMSRLPSSITQDAAFYAELTQLRRLIGEFNARYGRLLGDQQRQMEVLDHIGQREIVLGHRAPPSACFHPMLLASTPGVQGLWDTYRAKVRWRSVEAASRNQNSPLLKTPPSGGLPGAARGLYQIGGAPGGARTLNPRIKSPLLCH